MKIEKIGDTIAGFLVKIDDSRYFLCNIEYIGYEYVNAVEITEDFANILLKEESIKNEDIDEISCAIDDFMADSYGYCYDSNC
ncbi:MAG: hypothetical protein ACRCX2_37115 [Paraclostridium sp.]